MEFVKLLNCQVPGWAVAGDLKPEDCLRSIKRQLIMREIKTLNQLVFS